MFSRCCREEVETHADYKLLKTLIGSNPEFRDEPNWSLIDFCYAILKDKQQDHGKDECPCLVLDVYGDIRGWVYCEFGDAPKSDLSFRR